MNEPVLSVARYAPGTHDLASGVHAWLTPNGGWGESNAAIVCGHGASVLVDTLWDLPRTAEMLAGFRALGSAPITHVINTHADGDHWFGNQLTGADTIIATRTAARAMRQHGPGDLKKLARVSRLLRGMSRLPFVGRPSWRIAADYFDGMTRAFNFAKIRPTLPNSTFVSTMNLEVGGRLLHLFEVGPSHTSGDLIVHLPDDRLVLAGDVVFQGSTPILWDGSANHWIETCDRILRLKPDVVLPGHGPVTDLASVETVRQYWQFLWEACRRHYEKSNPAHRAALAIVRSDDFEKQPFARWDGRERIMINVHSIYRRLMKLSRHAGAIERLDVLRKTAMLAELLQRE